MTFVSLRRQQLVRLVDQRVGGIAAQRFHLSIFWLDCNLTFAWAIPENVMDLKISGMHHESLSKATNNAFDITRWESTLDGTFEWQESLR